VVVSATSTSPGRNRGSSLALAMRRTVPAAMRSPTLRPCTRTGARPSSTKSSMNCALRCALPNAAEVAAAGATWLVAGNSVFGAPDAGAAFGALREIARRGVQQMA
jgi:hypothetical protein